MFFNAHTDEKTRKLSPADFLPYMKRPEEKPQSTDQQQEMLGLIEAAMGVKR